MKIKRGFAGKVANLVFVLGVLFSILIMVYAIYRINNPIYSFYLKEFADYPLVIKARQLQYYIFILCSGISAILFYLGFRWLSDNLKLNLSISIIVTVILTYSFEFYLESPKIIQRAGVPYDMRSSISVLNDLKDSGVTAHHNIYPNQLIESNGLETNKGRIYPLGGISNTTVIGKNESGFYPIIETDEHGFKNPKGLYKKNKVDILLLGDSFTEGETVYSDENIGAVLRESDLNVISIGKGGNGPLLELSGLKEYGEPLEPNIVLWIYYQNDFRNLSQSINSSFLKKYLHDENFSQNLIARQDEIDKVLINYIQRKLNLRDQKKLDKKLTESIKKERLAYNSLIRITKLTNLRTRFKQILSPPHNKIVIKDEELKVFKQILKRSKNMVTGWGGKLYFIYLPMVSIKDDNRELMLLTVNELNIPIIDLYNEMMISHDDPLSFLPFRSHNHYNAKGYRYIAKTIIKKINF